MNGFTLTGTIAKGTEIILTGNLKPTEYGNFFLTYDMVGWNKKGNFLIVGTSDMMEKLGYFKDVDCRLEVNGCLNTYKLENGSFVGLKANTIAVHLPERSEPIVIYSNNLKYCFKIKNNETGEITSHWIHENPRLRTSMMLEKIEEAKAGDIIFKKYTLVEKGSQVISEFKSTHFFGMSLSEKKLNYGNLYIPNERDRVGSTSNDILEGLKKYPDEGGSEKCFSKLRTNFINMLSTRKYGQYDILCCVPGHLAKPHNQNSIAMIIKATAEGKSYKAYPDTILRIKNTPEQKKTSSVDRSVDTHLSTIWAYKNVVDKDILIVDDIVTSGSSMKACKQLLLKAGARSVTCFAFGMAHTNWWPENKKGWK